MKERLFAILLAGLTLVGSSNAAQPTGKHEPDFTLTISTENSVVKSQKGMEIFVSVEEKNISRHSINAGRQSEAGDWYTMSVMLDGHPAPNAERYREIITPKKPDPNAHVTFSGAVWTIKPAESMTFEVPIGYITWSFAGTAKYSTNTHLWSARNNGTWTANYRPSTDTGNSHGLPVWSRAVPIQPGAKSLNIDAEDASEPALTDEEKENQ
jgi:hypothetical protein